MAWRPNLAKKTPDSISTKGSTWTGGGIVRKPYADYNIDWDMDRAVKDALMKVTWVYRCVEAIAGNAARVPVVTRKNNPYDGELFTVDSLNYVFNSKANVGESSFEFRKRLSAQLLLSRKGVFVEVERSRGGELLSLSLLPPKYVEPIKDIKKYVTGYEVKIPTTDGRGNPIVLEKTLKADQVIWIKNPHPFDPYMGMTPLESLGLSIETDWYAKLYNRNFLLNDGRPGGLIIVKGQVSDEDREELKARFRGNISMAGRIGVITSDSGADFVDTATTPRDAQYIESRSVTKEEIMIGFGVPESVLSNAAGRTFDNAEIERVIFWQETMLPHLELVNRAFDVLLEERDEFISNNLDNVDVLQRMDMKRKEFVMREFDSGLIDIDEYRLASGRDILPTSKGKVLFRPNTRIPFAMTDGSEIYPMPGVVSVEDAQKQLEAQLKPKEPQQNASGTEGRPADQTVTEQPEEDPVPRETENVPRPPNASRTKSENDQSDLEYLELVESKFVVDSDIDSRHVKGLLVGTYDTWTKNLESTIRRFFDRQQRVVLEKAAGQKTRKLFSKREKILSDGPITGPMQVSLKSAVDSIYDQSVWDKQLREDVEPILRAIYEESVKAVAEDQSSLPEEIEDMISFQLDRVLGMNSSTKNAIEKAIIASLLVDDKTDGLTDWIKPVFEDTAIKLASDVASTEVTAALNGAKWAMTKDLPSATKSWVALGEEDEHLHHADLDGQVIPMSAKFVTDGVELSYPGDLLAPYEQVFGCKCALDVRV